MIDRRNVLAQIGGAAALLTTPPLAAQGARAASSLDPYADMHWRAGIEGQRRADLGTGKFLNPVFAGDHPDPSIVRDGEDYYITFSSFDAYPGIVIWHSRDLVNWQPVTAALHTPIGSVWAPELIHHAGRFYCYIPARRPDRRSIYVIHAESIAGPWSDPVDLGLPHHIDPGHAVGADGQRWLFLSGGDRVRLSADGLATVGAVEHVYDPWHYPADWVVEGFSPEGPKIVRRGGYYYMTTAVGGTAGPPTSHMVIMARARTLDGPWENHPRNPLVRTASARVKWWSRGHATLFEGPGGQWWMIYHGYENGYWTLGRQTLLEPVQWGADAWPEARGGDLSGPLTMPRWLAGQQHGQALSDDFRSDRLGTSWSFHDPAANEAGRLRRVDGKLHLAGKGSSPGDASPLTLIAGDQAYRIEVDIEIDPGCEAGLLLFYNRRLYAGLGIAAQGLVMHRYGLQRQRSELAGVRALRLRLTNDHNIVTLHTSSDAGASWRKFDVQMEVSGYHHNVAGDFLSLRPALYAAGTGEALRQLQLSGAGMNLDRRTMLLAALAGTGALAQTPPPHGRAVPGFPGPTETIDLWPGGAAGAPAAPLTETVNERSTDPQLTDRAVFGISRPRMAVFRPQRANGAAILITPGGGYRWVVVDKEGYELGRWLAARGYTVFVLFYRLPGEGWAAGADVALADAQRAMRLIRHRARDFGIDPERVGAMGFSAGGHVCADLAARFAVPTYAAVDAADQFSSRPVVAAPIYPVVSMSPAIAHPGSRMLLLGNDASPAREAAHSPDRNVTAATPPCFIVHAMDDDVVPVDNSLRLAAALRARNVSVELHLFAQGGHGFGLRKAIGKPVAAWPELFVAWAPTTALG